LDEEYGLESFFLHLSKQDMVRDQDETETSGFSSRRDL